MASLLVAVCLFVFSDWSERRQHFKPLIHQASRLFGVATMPLRRSRAWSLSGLFILSTILSLNIHLFTPPAAMAASEVLAPGAYIVDMGQPTQTIANGLKPYGLVYDLVVTKGIPVKWAINPNKIREGVDFIAGGKRYKGSAFIIPAELAAEAAPTISIWKAQGVVVDGPISKSFTAPIFTQIDSFPNAVLDFQNGAIAQSYYTNAGIPASTTGPFGSFVTYRFDYPSGLTSCDDLFVMPHADPAWVTHQNLIPFVQSRGFIWAACHAVSGMERLDDPGDADTLPDMNFLSHVPPAKQDSPSLKLFGTHALPTVGPYQYVDMSKQVLPYGYATNNLWAYPIMQFLGKIDTATQNGSEQVYIPDVGGAQWRDSTAITVYDDNNTDAVVVPTQGNSPPSAQIKAAKMAYGAAFGNPNNGMVMYEAGHSHAKATLPDNIAAQRAFLNYVLLADIVRGLNVVVNVPSEIGTGQTVSANASATGGSGKYAYQWYSSCGGSFSNPNGAHINFTAPAKLAICHLRVVVIDTCSRRSIGLSSALIVGPKADLSITKNDGQTNLPTGSPITPTNNSSADKDAIVPVADLSITKTDNKTNVVPGTPLDYVITVSNNGPSTVTDLTVTDSITPKLLNPRFTPAAGSYNASTGQWTGFSLMAGQGITLLLQGTVAAGATGNLINTASVAPPAGVTDPDNTNNSNTDTLTLTPTADLSINTTDGQSAVDPGAPIVYTLRITNNGPSAVRNAAIGDAIPATITNVTWICDINTATGSCGATNGSGNNLNTSVTLNPGAIVTYIINGIVSPTIPSGYLTNIATVAVPSGVTDNNLDNNTNTDTNTTPRR
jgi:uncharacterized repeat protein (TIGR01451 family)